MTPDELKSIPKGEFAVIKIGSHPMRTWLRLFLDWGITFGEHYQTSEHEQRKVYRTVYSCFRDCIDEIYSICGN